MHILPSFERSPRLLRGEIAVSVQPRLAGRVDAGDQRRMHAFAGRALTAALLEAEQNHRGRRLALLQRALSAGVVEGLGLAFDEKAIRGIESADQPLPENPTERAETLALAQPRELMLEGGLALAASGEEVVVPQALVFDALALPVMAPDWLLEGTQAPPSAPSSADGSVLHARRVGRALRDEIDAGRALPRVGVIVLEPVEHLQVAGEDPFDQCERDLDAEAFEDQQRQEGGRLLYYPWPVEWLPLPAPDTAWRNRLAWQIFTREALLGSAQAMPWHAVGIPLALVAFNSAWQPMFADRAAVVRAGGRPPTRALVPASGSRLLWQARVEQLAEHLAEARSGVADVGALAAQLRLLPPAGLLPADAMDVRARLNRFFPPTLDLFAAPVPLEQLDLLMEEAAGLAAIDLSGRDRIGVYVPVPQALFESDLLVVEQADPGGEIARAQARFLEARADWLRRRQQQRAQQFVHRQALEGKNAAPPANPADDPARLENESLGVPAPDGLLHRSALAPGMHQHFVEAVPEALTPQPGDTLYAWALLDREHPPQQLMLQFNVEGWEHRAFWGADLIAWGAPGTASRLRQDERLPEAGVWVRLGVPAAALGVADRPVTGMAFTLFGGRACFGPAGVLRGAEELPWLTAQRLASGRAGGAGEGWDIVADPDRDAPLEPPLGTQVVDGVRRSMAIAGLLQDASLAALKVVPAGAGPDQGVTLAQRLTDQGLRVTAADLAARLDEADDAINLGYLRVQTDLYRLRQTVLKQGQATRFAVSSALTQIADLDNATATGEQLSAFYEDLKSRATVVQREGDAPVFNAAIRATAAQPLATAMAASTVRANALLTGSNAGSAPASRLAGLTTRVDPMAQPQASRVLFEAGLADLGISALERARRTSEVTSSTSTGVTGADALTGKAEIRTTSIAARMERPRSVETKDFTVATRFDLIDKLAGLGLDMDALPVTGLATRANDANGAGAAVEFDGVGQPRRVHQRTLGELRGTGFFDVRSDPDPQDTKADEAAFFLGAVDLSDHTVALLRRAEGLVRRYRDALALCRKALAQTDAALEQVDTRLGVLERELAEARQDVATARALMAEEVERARALNARRDEIVATQVRFLAYARVRVAPRGPGTALAALAAPTRALDAAQEPDAVPQCLAEHGDPPADLAAMLDVVRRAPIAWFPAMRLQLRLIDHPLLADRFIAALRPQAAMAGASAMPSGLQASQASALARSFALAQAHASDLLQLRATALPQAQAALQPQVTLSTKVEWIGRAATLQDLLAGAAERSELQRRAAQELERMGAVASCLHARLSNVRAAIRLVWAERFSQFDQARGRIDLADLSTLPRFGELPREERDDIVELAGWLQGRADRGNPAAVALMADLVRVCVLAASHSPVGEIVAGRIVRPLPLNPGVVIDVRPLLPARVRLGMQVQLIEGQRITARAVVTDLVDGVAAVRVTQTVSADLLPTAATAARFVLQG